MAAILPSLRLKSFSPYFQLLRLRYFSTASPDPRFMEKYLVKCRGLSAAEAAKASRTLAHLQSTKTPDTVISFMRSQGFGPADLRMLIAKTPGLLLYNVKRTLAPKLESLRSMGFSESDLVDVLVAQPRIFLQKSSRSFLPKLKMWEHIFGSRELLIKHIKWKSRFLTISNEQVVSNIKFLREECGIPRERVYHGLRMNPRLVVPKTDSLRALAARAEELGVPRKSRMFFWSLNVLGSMSKQNYEAKRKLMRTIGWSDSELVSAFMKAPYFLGMSQEALRRKVDFFLKKVGCSPSYLAERPKLLMHSLEKRLIPRLRVMEMLKSEGLEKLQPFFFFTLPDREFREKYVLGYKDKAPKLLDML